MDKIFIEKIQKMSEKDFTQKIIMLIFEYMGYEKIIYHGGVNEYGRDIIMWGEDKLGNKEVAVAQVKMDKLNSNSSSGSSFITVANQLIMALSHEIPNEDGYNYKPVDVYFVTPQDIDTREITMAGTILKDKSELKFIDLTMLVKLIEKYNLEENISLLFNEKSLTIQDYLYSNVHNDELYKALAISGKKDEMLYYSDLDISFLNFEIDIYKDYSYKNLSIITIKDKKWEEFKKFITNEYSILLEFFDILNIEKNYGKYNDEGNTSNLSTLKRLYSEYKEISTRIIENIKEYELKKDFNQNVLTTIKILLTELKKLTSNLENKNFKLEIDLKNNFGKIITKLINDLKLISINSLTGLEKTLLKNIKDSIMKSIEVLNTIIVLKDSTIENKSYSSIVNIDKMKYSLNLELFEYQKNLNDINNIKNVCEIQKKFSTSNTYFKDSGILTIQKKNIFKTDKRISDLINGNINIIIEANAGSGKTTSLQHYSKNGDINKTKIFIPLAKVIKYIHVDETDNLTIIKQHNILINAICKYFNNLNHKNIIDENKFKRLLLLKNTVVLFDGVDEVLSKYTWVFNVINYIIKKYKAVIAASTRPSFIDNNKLENFVKIKLLDFNDEQREKFINGWFNNKEISNRLIKHINDNKMTSVINNPFSATILCRLAERKIPLPKTETNMYEERLRLLLGEYDEYKGINRNSKYRLDLEKIAIKIAYIFHKNSTRTMSINLIINKLILEKTYNEEEELREYVKELISPCNILIDEYGDEEYTFGHFRYQEYLVAKELQNNRGVDIKTYLDDNFWIGALSLFSQITDNIFNIIDKIFENSHSIDKYKYILTEMINKRNNQKEKEELLRFIEKQNQIEKIDIFFEKEFVDE